MQKTWSMDKVNICANNSDSRGGSTDIEYQRGFHIYMKEQKLRVCIQIQKGLHTVNQLYRLMGSGILASFFVCLWVSTEIITNCHACHAS